MKIKAIPGRQLENLVFDDGKEKQTKLHAGVETKTRQTSIAHFMFDLESKQAGERKRLKQFWSLDCLHKKPLRFHRLFIKWESCSTMSVNIVLYCRQSEPFLENKSTGFEICFRFLRLWNDFLGLRTGYCEDCQVVGGCRWCFVHK